MGEDREQMLDYSLPHNKDQRGPSRSEPEWLSIANVFVLFQPPPSSNVT